MTRGPREHGTGGQGDPAARDDGVRWEDHPLYGPIPYRRASPAGYELTFRPDLPAGAIRGEPLRQSGFCPHCRPPNYFYVDQELRCRECGTVFTWPAGQQRFWYEVLRLSVAGRPPGLCPGCRRERRTARRIGQRLARAADGLHENPDDVDALLEFASAMAEHGRHLGSGDMTKGIAAARKASRLDPGAITAHFWEAACHEVAGHFGRAAGCYRRFIDKGRTRKTPSMREMLKESHRRLADPRMAGPVEDR